MSKILDFFLFFAKVLTFTNSQNMYNLQIEYFTPFPRELLGSKLKGHWTGTLIRHCIIKYILQPIKAISNVKINRETIISA